MIEMGKDGTSTPKLREADRDSTKMRCESGCESGVIKA